MNVRCMYGALYGACMVHIQGTRNLQIEQIIKNKFMAFIWCMYGAFVMTKIIQRRTAIQPSIQAMVVISCPIGKQYE